MPQKAAVIPIRSELPATRAGVASAARLRESPTHPHIELNFLYSGAARYFVGGRFLELGAGTLAVFWGALPRQVVEREPDTQLMFARVPLAAVLGYDLAGSFTRKLLGGELLIDPQAPSHDAEPTRRWAADHASGDAALLRACDLEIEARLRRLSAKRQQRLAPRSPEHKARRQVEGDAAFLAESYRESISTVDIGRAVGLHPNYAMTLFRRECGMSIWQYLIRLRLAHAQLMLLTSDETVLAIALDSGFGSLARFYAAFTRECAISPGEFRKARPGSSLRAPRS